MILFNLKKIISAIAIPPLGFLILLFIVQLLNYKRKKIMHVIVTVLIFFVLLCSTPLISTQLMSFVSYPEVVDIELAGKSQAIVILGGGLNFNAIEYDGDDLSAMTLERVRYGAHLFNQLGLPILVTGGKTRENQAAEADVMRHVLENSFLVPVKWTESESLDTYENAIHSFRILQEASITKIVLVTHSWHMNRAIQMFEKAGFEVVPAATIFPKRSEFEWMTLVPNAKAFNESSQAFKEIYGMLWYALK